MASGKASRQRCNDLAPRDKKAASQGGLSFRAAGQRLAACIDALAEVEVDTALALLMLSIGVEAVPMVAEALMSGALAAVTELAAEVVVSVVDVVDVVLTSSFFVHPPRANCEARATARVMVSESERIMADSS